MSLIKDKFREIKEYVNSRMQFAILIAQKNSGGGSSSVIEQIKKAIAELAVVVTGKQDKLTAGQNITIQDNVISSEGGGAEYVAGENISITNNKISAIGYSVGNGFSESGGKLTVHIRKLTQSEIQTFLNLGYDYYNYIEVYDNISDESVGWIIVGNNSYRVVRSEYTDKGGLGDVDLFYVEDEIEGVDENNVYECECLIQSGNATGLHSHTEGESTTASGQASHAEGYNTISSGDYSHSEGINTTASGNDSHAEGYNTSAYNIASHAEGSYTTASGSRSHAEGSYTTASGSRSHAEGESTTASGQASHAEGYNSKAQGIGSHAEGGIILYDGQTYIEVSGGKAVGNASHAEGIETISNNEAEHAQGKYNKSNQLTSTNTIHSTGIGTADNDRKNAFEIMDNGDVYVVGLGGYDGTNPENSKTLQQIIQEMTTRQIVVDNTTASKEIDPNVLYIFNNRTSDLTITLGTPQPDIVNEYHLIMSIGDTVPTITWPVGITWPTGEPKIYAYNTLEVSIINNVAMYVQY